MSDIIIEAFLVEPIEEAVNKESIKKLFNTIKDKLMHIIRSIIAKIKAVRDKIKEKISNKKNKNTRPNDDDFDYGTDDIDYATDKARTWLLNYNAMPPEQKECVHDIFINSIGERGLRFSKHTSGMLNDTDVLIKSKDALSRLYEEVKNTSSSDFSDSNSGKFVKDICKILHISDIDGTDPDSLDVEFDSELNDNLVFIKLEDVIKSPLYKELVNYWNTDPRKWDKLIDSYDDCINICEKISGALATGVSAITKQNISIDSSGNQYQNQDNANAKKAADTMDAVRNSVTSSSNESIKRFKSYFKKIYDVLKIIWFCIGANNALILFIYDAYYKLYYNALQMYNDNNENKK